MLWYVVLLLSRQVQSPSPSVFPLSSLYGDVVANEAHVLLRWLAHALTSNAVAPLRRRSLHHHFANESTLAAVEYAFGAPPGVHGAQRVRWRVDLRDSELVARLQPHAFSRVRRNSSGVVSRIVFFYDVRVSWKRRADKHSSLLPFTTVRVSVTHVAWEPSFGEFANPTEFPTHGHFVATERLSEQQCASIDLTPRALAGFV
jgi:hypothetical protein